jgi:PKD repeat protein
MRLPWIARRSRRARRAIGSKQRTALPLWVRRLERRRVLDASLVGILVSSPADEGDTVFASAIEPMGQGTLFYNWEARQEGDLIATSFDSTFSFVAPDNGLVEINLTLEDSTQVSAFATTSLVVDSIAPTAVLTNDGPVNEGSPVEVTLSDQFDPSSADTQAGFRYAYDFDNDGSFDVGDGSYSGSVSDASQQVPGSFLDDGPGAYTVRARVIDKDGEFTDYMSNIDVLNVAPTATLANDGPVNEGSPAEVTFSDQFDPSSADTQAGFRYAYDFDNDGSFDVGDGGYGGSVSDASQQVPGSFLGEGPGTYTVRARIIDIDGDFTDYTTDIDVLNFAPVLENVSGDVINENEAATVTATIVDPSTSDVFEVDVDWQDGTSDTIVGLGNMDDSGTVGGTSYVWTAAGRQLALSHLYHDDVPSITSSDDYAVELTVRDDDLGSTGPYLATVTVKNVPPTLTAPYDGAMVMVDEGTLLELTDVGTFTDPGFDNPLNMADPDDVDGTSETFTFSINWGDGTTADTGDATVDMLGGVGVLTTGSFDGLHTYADNGLYTVTITVFDDDSGSDFATFNVTVKNVPPTLTAPYDGAMVMVDEGTELVLPDVGTFTDPGFDNPLNMADPDDVDGTSETFTFSINWGDGTTADTGDATVDMLGGVGMHTAGSFDGSHTYADNGLYTVTVTVFDDDGGSDFATFNVTVKNVPPTLTAPYDGAMVMVDEGTELVLPDVGTFTDPGFDNPLNMADPDDVDGTSETFTFSINWGDGTTADTGDATVDMLGGVGMDTAGSFDGSHTYADNGLYTVTITVFDDDGGSDFATFTVTVKNVPPTLTAPYDGAMVMVDEGTELSLIDVGTFTDPGFDNPLNMADPDNGGEVAETFTFSINWGDGTTADTGDATVDVLGGVGMDTAGSFDGSHTYADNGLYTVTVTVFDDDGGSDFATFTVLVKNVPPTLTAPYDGAMVMVDEGTLLELTDVGTFTDPGFDNPLNMADPDNGGEVAETFTFSINWGDGTTADTGDATVDMLGGVGMDTAGSFDGSHTYADNGLYTVTVTVFDDDGGSDFATFIVTVKNVPPTLTAPYDGAMVMVDEGTLLELPDVGTFTDPGFDNPLNMADPDNGGEVAETFTFSINWGDGTTADTGDATVDMLGGVGMDTAGSFDGSHTYADNGLYTVTVTVFDDDGGSDFATFTVTVKNVPPTLTAPYDGAMVMVDEGTLLSLTDVGTFTDPGFDNPLNMADPDNGGEVAETFTFSINWGDGTTADTGDATVDMLGGVGMDTAGSFDGSHTYADNGLYTVTVTVFDDDGGSDFATFTVTVKNVAPSISGDLTNLQVDEGQPFILSDLGGTTLNFGLGITDPGFDNPLNTLDPTNGGEVAETFIGMTIDWGDGTAPDVLTAVNRVSTLLTGPTTAQFEHLPHVYADDGDYVVTILLVDDDNGPLQPMTFTIHVNNVAPELTLTTEQFTINEGQTLVLPSLGTFTDPGFSDPNNPPSGSVETFTYTINWGDGNIDTGQLPATVNNGARPNPATPELTILTTGTLANSHFYADNDADNKYTITVTLIDDDGGMDVKSFEITVLNVNPTLDPIAATDIDANTGTTTLTLSFSDPGADSFEILVDWGDQILTEPIPDNRFVVEMLYAGPTPNTFVLVHQYTGPPDPNNPTADITIRVKIRDDDFATLGVIEPGESNVETVAISNPGIQTIMVAIDTTPDVPRLELSNPPTSETFVSQQAAATQVLQTADVRRGGGELAAATERFLQLHQVFPDGTLGPGYRIRDEALLDLRGFFRTLPDGRYEIYLVRTQVLAAKKPGRFVIGVDVRRGQVIDVSDDSAGGRDRPPTAEQPTDAVQPLDENPLLERAPDASTRVQPRVPQDQAAMDATTHELEARDQGETDVDRRSLSGWLPASLPLGLVAAASGGPWSRRVDRALAEADDRSWQRLRRAGRVGRVSGRVPA